jgi:tubulin-specific chaperone A
MSLSADLLKQLEIKSKVVQRIMKELQLYRKEEQEEKSKVDKLKAGGADPYDIKYAVRVICVGVCLCWCVCVV